MGSGHFVEMAKANGWNIEAVLNNDIVGGDRSPQQDTGKRCEFSPRACRWLRPTLICG